MMRQRDLRRIRQHHQRHRDSLTATLRHGTIGGYVTDGCRCDACRLAMRNWQRARRAAQRPVTRYLTADAQLQAAKRREEALATAKSEATSELAELIRQQEKDSYFVVHRRPWLVSLDALWGDSDSDEDHYERGGIVTYIGRRRGDFTTEAPWLPPLIERLDRELELRRCVQPTLRRRHLPA